MSRQLTVSEKYSRYWPAIAVGSAVLAVLFYLLFYFASSVLYQGYMRLISFAFFALSVLSFFKVREGKINIQIEQTDENLFTVTYRNGGKMLYSEEISGKDIAEIKIARMPNRSLYDDISRHDRCIKIRKKQSDDWVYFNVVNGKIIPLSVENAASIKAFIEQPD